MIESSNEPIVITSLSVIEITSAFRRKYTRGELTEARRDGLLVTFFEEATDRYTITPVDETVFEIAFDLVLEGDLRTLDSLQLGAALELETSDREITFVCADEKLVQVAREYDLSATNSVVE